MLNFKPMPLIKTALRYVADVGAFGLQTCYSSRKLMNICSFHSLALFTVVSEFVHFPPSDKPWETNLSNRPT
jgi:hypothetical protein